MNSTLNCMGLAYMLDKVIQRYRKKMKGIAKKIEITANISIIVVAIMIVATLVHRYFSTPKTQALSTISVGTKLTLSDVDWVKNGRTLVLALQEGCHYCSESALFYQRLVAAASKKNIQIVAVFPQPVESAQKYLNNFKIPVNNVKQATLKSIGVQGTPTILLVGNKGDVMASWIGKLPASKEIEVLESLR
jgi:thioredoxin-related protein